MIPAPLRLRAAWTIWGMPQTNNEYAEHLTRVSWTKTVSVTVGLSGFTALVLQAAIGRARRFSMLR